MKIILIPCSGSKVHGGQSNPQPPKLADGLSPAAFQKLASALQELEAILQDARSPFGFKNDDGENKYLPAYQRYKGLIYAHSGISRLYPAFKGRLVIVSALYGLLDGGDFIRDYDLSMKDTLPTGMNQTKIDPLERKPGADSFFPCPPVDFRCNGHIVHSQAQVDRHSPLFV